MDPSSLSDGQQLHLQYQEYQAQQQQEPQQHAQPSQQQNPDYASQPYDPTQAQSYDQSTQACYSYYQQFPHQSQHDQQFYSYYHQPDSSAAYQQHQPESAPVNPPRAPVLQESAQIADTDGGAGVVSAADRAGQGQGQGQVQVQQQHGVVYTGGGELHGSNYPMQSGLNPAAAAAVAALSQLTQFAGTMGAAERAMADLQAKVTGFGALMGSGQMHYDMGAMYHRVGPPPYSRGRRAAGPFNGTGRGNFGRHNPRSAGPVFRGRGHGRGRWGHRRFPPRDESSLSAHPVSTEDSEPIDEEAEPSADAPEGPAQSAIQTESSLSAATPGNKVSQVPWCELCRVNCTSFEILEQHKNGKRHKKNLRRVAELKNVVKPAVHIQSKQQLVADSKPELFQQPEQPETLEVATDANEVENDQQNHSVEQPEVPVESFNLQARKPTIERFDSHKRGMKRRMRGGRGGKRMKTHEASRSEMLPPRPKVVIPLICDLCNVKCDTQEVFDRHLSGKKHIAKLKRFENHQAMFGPTGLQALYPPNPTAQAHFFPQGNQQPFHGLQASQPPENDTLTQLTPLHQFRNCASRFQQNPKPQGSGSSLESGHQSTVIIAQGTEHQVISGNGEVGQTAAANANQAK